MLDQTTKKRINDLRDTLVGKLPDPKSQVEQIMIAMIYKFKNDMDDESKELGGNKSFFIGDYEKYSWENLFNSKFRNDLVSLIKMVLNLWKIIQIFPSCSGIYLKMLTYLTRTQNSSFF